MLINVLRKIGLKTSQGGDISDSVCDVEYCHGLGVSITDFLERFMIM